MIFVLKSKIIVKGSNTSVQLSWDPFHEWLFHTLSNHFIKQRQNPASGLTNHIDYNSLTRFVLWVDYC